MGLENGLEDVFRHAECLHLTSSWRFFPACDQDPLPSPTSFSVLPAPQVATKDAPHMVSRSPFCLSFSGTSNGTPGPSWFDSPPSAWEHLPGSSPLSPLPSKFAQNSLTFSLQLHETSVSGVKPPQTCSTHSRKNCGTMSNSLLSPSPHHPQTNNHHFLK